MRIMDKNLHKMKKILLSFFVGVIAALNIASVDVEAEAPTTHVVMKYDSQNRVTGRFVYNNKGYLYESRLYNPSTKKLTALRYFYKNTGRMNSKRTYNAKGKLTRFDSWYNVSSRSQSLGRKARSVIYDSKGKIDREIAYTKSGRAKSVGKFIEPIKRGLSKITSRFGGRRRHTGLDMSLGRKGGQPIYAANSGKVVKVVKHSNRGYGHYVIIDHGNGVKSLYGHMKKVSVRKGQNIWKNQKIGTIGRTGIATGYHVHFEYRKKNKKKNPKKYLKKAIYYKR